MDHATLGARLHSDVDRRVVVDDILEESDAYRRGLRFGDEVIRFGGREVSTVNAFKNVLGIFPKDWRVPMTYRHRGETYDVLVRLRGLHATAELAGMLKSGPGGKPEHDPKPGEPAPGEPRKRPRPQHHRPAKPAPMPEIVKQHFVEKPGYVNYYFNQVHRDRVWKALVARGDYKGLAGAWTIAGQTAAGEKIEFEISDTASSIRLESGELAIELDGDLATRLGPPGSGGLLVSLAMWRRLLVGEPDDFGDLTYWGTAPVPGVEGLADVLAGAYRDIECRFYFDPDDGQLAAIEMLPEKDVDPCELYFADYREVQGRMLPGRIEIRHGDNIYRVVQCQEYAFAPVEEAD